MANQSNVDDVDDYRDESQEHQETDQSLIAGRSSNNETNSKERECSSKMEAIGRLVRDLVVEIATTLHDGQSIQGGNSDFRASNDRSRPTSAEGEAASLRNQLVQSLTNQIEKLTGDLERSQQNAAELKFKLIASDKKVELLQSHVDLLYANIMRAAPIATTKYWQTMASPVTQRGFAPQGTKSKLLPTLTSPTNQLGCGSNGTPTPRYLQHLSDVSEQLKTILTSVDDVSSILCQSLVITSEEFENIMKSREKATDAAQKLIEIVLQKPTRAHYDSFLRVLKEKNQVYAYILLTEFLDISTLPHVETMRQHYMFLLDSIDPKFSGLINTLCQSKVITTKEKEDLEVEEGVIRRNAILLSLMSRKSHRDYEYFLSALEKTDQKHVAEVLRGKVDAVNEKGQTESSSDNEPNELVVSWEKELEDRDKKIITMQTKMQKMLFEIFSLDANSKLTLVHPFPEEEDYVMGLTTLEEQLYVIKKPPDIAVYDTKNFVIQRHLSVPGLLHVIDMTSCRHFRCVYLADRIGKTVHRVEVKTTEADDKFTMWKDDDQPWSLSVNADHNVVVTYCTVNKIKVFSTIGKKLTQVDLQDVVHPVHTIQLTSDEFVLCHGVRLRKKTDTVQRVCIVDGKGIVQQSFGSSWGSDENHVHAPERLAVANGFIFVADKDNNRVLMLSSTLKYIRTVVSNLKWHPMRICLNEQAGRLYLAENNWKEDEWTTGQVYAYSIACDQPED